MFIAFANGLSRICWPFHVDQPTLAAQLSEINNVAYELLEVRTGERGLKPLYRTGRAPLGTLEAVREEASIVLEKAFGDDGLKKRANLKKLQEAILSTWNEDGSSRRDLDRLVASVQPK